jgi:hypothetical protein
MNKAVLAVIFALAIITNLVVKSSMDLTYKLSVVGLTAFLIVVAVGTEAYFAELKKQ